MAPDGCMEAAVILADRWLESFCDGSVLVDVAT